MIELAAQDGHVTDLLNTIETDIVKVLKVHSGRVYKFRGCSRIKRGIVVVKGKKHIFGYCCIISECFI